MDAPWMECQRIDAFTLWFWRRLLRVPWTAKRLSQLILKKMNPGKFTEGRMLKLKLQYFGHLIGKDEKDPETEKDGRQKENGMAEDEMVR